MTWHLSDDGYAFLQRVEGFKPTAYPDSTGKNTIGFGHLIQPGEKFSTITREQGLAILRDDVPVAESILNRWVKCDLSQNQADALISFIFNEGAGDRKKDGFVWLRNGNHSTMLGLLNDNNTLAASKQFSLWVKAGGNVIQGLVNRRAAEQKLFVGGDYGAF